MNTVFLSILSASLLLSQGNFGDLSVPQNTQLIDPIYQVLAADTMDLSTRNPVENINNGFKENILVNVGYLNRINGDKIVLLPGEVFAFHKNILPEFKKNKVVTQESEYQPEEGYKLVAGLYGNGVCHLATLMNFVASEAGLEVTAPASHDFAPVPGFERKYGTSIKFYPNTGGTSERQNLYIRNNKDYPVKFKFSLDGNLLHFAIRKVF